MTEPTLAQSLFREIVKNTGKLLRVEIQSSYTVPPA